MNPVGQNAHLGWAETLRRETESLQSHLSETEIPIGETEVTRVCGAMSRELDGAG